MAAKTRYSEFTDHPVLRFVLQLLGYATCIAAILAGGGALFILLIGGLWEGFSRTGYTLAFLTLALYILVTAWLAFRFARRPTKRAGLVLAGLVLPAVIYIAVSGGDRPDLRESVRIYVANEDPDEVSEARATLLEHGRRAGNPPHVRALIEALQEADDDAQRIRVVELLAELSRQNASVIAELERLREATAGDPEREPLHHATGEALDQVDPYRSH